jgi:hypothetical protein
MSPTKTHLGGGIEVLNLCEGCVKDFLVGSGFTKFRVAARNGAASVLHKMGVVVGCRAHSVKYHDKYIQLMLKNPCSQQASGRRPTE